MKEKIDNRIQELQDDLAGRKQAYFSRQEGCVNPQAVDELRNAIKELEKLQEWLDGLSKQNPQPGESS